MIAQLKPDNRIDALPLGVVVHGDALAALKTMESDSVDAIVTDPPAGISFMGKEWDNFTGKQKMYDSAGARAAANADKEKLKRIGQGTTPFGFSSSSGQPTKAERDAFIAFLASVMAEALRVLKPGGHALVWALPRTSHWTALALEDAGFEIREKLYHIFGSGFPKSHNISVAIDKHLKAEREVIGKSNRHGGGTLSGASWNIPAEIPNITAPATPEAEQWQGWGTATKPAVEEWILCRKPLAEPSIAANVLKYGTGGINVAASRVGNETRTYHGGGPSQIRYSDSRAGARDGRGKDLEFTAQGRWPANLLLSHSLWCIPNGTKRVRSQTGGTTSSTGNPKTQGIYGSYADNSHRSNHKDADGLETIEDWQCAEDCPIRLLDEQSGVRKSGARPARRNISHFANGHGTNDGIRLEYDQGGASRYFTNLPPDVPFLYTSKSSRRERNAGCEGLPEHMALRFGEKGQGPLPQQTPHVAKPETNNHPTVKSLSLMRWLVRLVTPPDGIVLDPFLGSGSTAVAAIHEGYHFIGIEQDASYVEIARARIAHARGVQP